MTPKVLFIGPYRDGTGYGHASVHYALALDYVGVDVVTRPLKLNQVNQKIPKRLQELEDKSVSGCDVVIQNMLPHQMSYNANFKKNIALFFTETSDFRSSSWSTHLNRMDEVWVSCNSSKMSCLNSEVLTDVRVVPVPCDVGAYQKSYPKLNLNLHEDEFVFYTIGEMTPRKNLEALLMAFHIEFGTNERVQLVIKAGAPGTSPAETMRQVLHKCNYVKQGLKLYKDVADYKSEIIITDEFTDNQIMSLHALGDCFVTPSRGEGWCIPAFDAMAMGNTPICGYHGPMLDFLKGSGMFIKCYKTPVFGMNNTFNDLYTANEDWYDIDIRALGEGMRMIFDNVELRQSLSKSGFNRAYEFSYEVIGNRMLDYINCDSKPKLRNNYHSMEFIRNE